MPEMDGTCPERRTILDIIIRSICNLKATSLPLRIQSNNI